MKNFETPAEERCVLLRNTVEFLCKELKMSYKIIGYLNKKCNDLEAELQKLEDKKMSVVVPEPTE